MKAEYGLASLAMAIPPLCIFAAYIDGPASWALLAACWLDCLFLLAHLLPRVDRHPIS